MYNSESEDIWCCDCNRYTPQKLLGEVERYYKEKRYLCTICGCENWVKEDDGQTEKK